MPITSNKLIAKNTTFLYVRMLFIMAVSLYTSRVVLKVLGVEDFGIYNVVGGVVTVFNFLKGSMSAGTSRFLTIALGKDDHSKLKEVFSATLSLHIAIALTIFVLAETIGLWFVSTRLVIPAERMVAAQWIYQFSILSVIISITQVPYDATIIAHERMNIYAYVSMIDILLRLLAAYMLNLFILDKLKLYGVLIFSITLIVAIIYRIYCKIKFKECTYHFHWNSKLFIELAKFSSWSLLSSFAWMLTTQGSNILLNLFFGPVVNAARAIAVQVNTAVSSFVDNFLLAVKPQIFKSYANNDRVRMHSLALYSAKYSFFILYILILPIILETHLILTIWLKEVPDNTVIFVQLMLVYSLIQTIDAAFVVVLQATNKIKENAIWAFTLGTLAIIVAYILFTYGYEPKSIFYILIFNAFLFSFGIKPFLLKKFSGLKLKDFVLITVIPVAKVAFVSSIIPTLISVYLPEGLKRFLLVCMTSLITIGISVLFLGISKIQRRKLYDFFVEKIRFLNK